MEYPTQASDGLPSQFTTVIKRDSVNRTGRDTHNVLAKVGIGAIADIVVFTSKNDISKK